MTDIEGAGGLGRHVISFFFVRWDVRLPYALRKKRLASPFTLPIPEKYFFFYFSNEAFSDYRPVADSKAQRR
jgi:hypothetical protein